MFELDYNDSDSKFSEITMTVTDSASVGVVAKGKGTLVRKAAQLPATTATTLTVTVCNAIDSCVSKSFDLTLTAVNDPPYFT